MASGGYRSHAPSSTNTTDFLEEWKAKREKMRAKLYGAELAAAAAAAGTAGGTDIANKPSNEMNNNNSSSNPSNSNNQACASSTVLKVTASRRPDEDQQVNSSVSQQNKSPGPVQDGVAGGETLDESLPLASQDSPSKAKEKGKNSSGPSARKGKGQIEKRKLREKRRSTGVVNIPSAEFQDLWMDFQDSH